VVSHVAALIHLHLPIYQRKFAPEKARTDVQRHSSEMSSFWKSRGPGVGSLKDEDFQQLLKAGKSSMKRHYELKGPLADLEKEQSGRSSS
jgi:hypothetical protein